jgi:hypothetical protein
LIFLYLSRYKKTKALDSKKKPKAKALDSKKNLKLKLWIPKKKPKAKALDSNFFHFSHSLLGKKCEQCCEKPLSVDGTHDEISKKFSHILSVLQNGEIFGSQNS